MMLIDNLLSQFADDSDNEAIISDDGSYCYGDILKSIHHWQHILRKHDIQSGNVVALIGDYSAESICLILALIQNKNIILPASTVAMENISRYLTITQAQTVINLTGDGEYTISKIKAHPEEHELLKTLIDKGHSGFILLTSGSTGEPKAVVHDFERLALKYRKATKRYRTLCFLLFDHIAGIDTYFYSLFSGGAVAFPLVKHPVVKQPATRHPATICRLIEKHQLEVLSTSPSFLNLMLISEEHENYNLDSLKIMTFGSEKMPEVLLEKLTGLFKNVKLIQKYGTTELGSPASVSKEGDTSWIKMDSDAVKTKIIDGILHVKTHSAMLGYLNAPNPFTEDGWFNTGDSVLEDGEYIKILGRQSDIINVGGEKVYPAEIENVIMEFDNVLEVSVFGEDNAILGEMVCAKVRLTNEEPTKEFRAKLKSYCFTKLDRFKVPAKIMVVSETLHNSRFKISRRGS